MGAMTLLEFLDKNPISFGFFISMLCATIIGLYFIKKVGEE
jgi:hypothetical protein